MARRNIACLLITMCLFGAVEIGIPTNTTATVNAAINGALRVHPSNPLFFTNNGGKAIYLSGDQINWEFQDHAFSQPYTYGYKTTLDWNWYINFAQRHGFNFLRCWSYLSIGKGASASDPIRYCNPQPYARTGPGDAIDGRPKFDLNEFNQAYFDRIRSRIIAAGKKGIYVAVMLFDGFDYIKSANKPPDTMWDGNIFNSANNINGISADKNGDGNGAEFFATTDQTILGLQKAYVRKVIDTVNDLDNVIYEVANEVYSKSWQAELIGYIRSYEAGKAKQHLVYRSPGGLDSNGIWRAEALSSLIDSGADLFGILGSWPGYAAGADVPANKQNEPGIWDNDHVHPTDPDYRYRYPWKAFTRGYHYILFDGPFCEGPELESEAYEITRYNIGAVNDYANNKIRDLSAMYPHNELSTTTYCLANPGIEYIVLQPDTAKRFTVYGLTPKQKYHYEWYDIYHHRLRATGVMTVAGSSNVFTPPCRSAVLYLRVRKR
jgi:hypothetical protein